MSDEIKPVVVRMVLDTTQPTVAAEALDRKLHESAEKQKKDALDVDAIRRAASERFMQSASQVLPQRQAAIDERNKTAEILKQKAELARVEGVLNEKVKESIALHGENSNQAIKAINKLREAHGLKPDYSRAKNRKVGGGHGEGEGEAPESIEGLMDSIKSKMMKARGAAGASVALAAVIVKGVKEGYKQEQEELKTRMGIAGAGITAFSIGGAGTEGLDATGGEYAKARKERMEHEAAAADNYFGSHSIMSHARSFASSAWNLVRGTPENIKTEDMREHERNENEKEARNNFVSSAKMVGEHDIKVADIAHHGATGDEFGAARSELKLKLDDERKQIRTKYAGDMSGASDELIKAKEEANKKELETLEFREKVSRIELETSNRASDAHVKAAKELHSSYELGQKLAEEELDSMRKKAAISTGIARERIEAAIKEKEASMQMADSRQKLAIIAENIMSQKLAVGEDVRGDRLTQGFGQSAIDYAEAQRARAAYGGNDPAQKASLANAERAAKQRMNESGFAIEQREIETSHIERSAQINQFDPLQGRYRLQSRNLAEQYRDLQERRNSTNDEDQKRRIGAEMLGVKSERAKLQFESDNDTRMGGVTALRASGMGGLAGAGGNVDQLEELKDINGVLKNIEKNTQFYSNDTTKMHP